MGSQKTRGRGRLRGIAAGLAAAAAAVFPGFASGAAVPLPEAVETEALAARFARAESALAEALARTDKATLRVFACDCAARVAPLYERSGRSVCLVLQRARARAAAGRSDPEPILANGATIALGSVVVDR